MGSLCRLTGHLAVTDISGWLRSVNLEACGGGGDWPCCFRLSFALFNDTVNCYDHTGSGDEFTRRNTCSSASLHTTNPIRPGLGLKPGILGDGRQLVAPATARPAITFAWGKPRNSNQDCRPSRGSNSDITDIQVTASSAVSHSNKNHGVIITCNGQVNLLCQFLRSRDAGSDPATRPRMTNRKWTVWPAAWPITPEPRRKWFTKL
jgi:hypothetical protein